MHHTPQGVRLDSTDTFNVLLAGGNGRLEVLDATGHTLHTVEFDYNQFIALAAQTFTAALRQIPPAGPGGAVGAGT